MFQIQANVLYSKEAKMSENKFDKLVNALTKLLRSEAGATLHEVFSKVLQLKEEIDHETEVVLMEIAERLKNMPHIVATCVYESLGEEMKRRTITEFVLDFKQANVSDEDSLTIDDLPVLDESPSA